MAQFAFPPGEIADEDLFEDDFPSDSPPTESPRIEVELQETPLWLFRRELARAAELMEDAERLTASGRSAAAAYARAELAQALHELGELAPQSPTELLASLVADLRELTPEIRQDAADRAADLVAAIRRWAGPQFDAAIAPLADPDRFVLARDITPPEPVHAFAGQEASEIAWSTEAHGTFVDAFSRAKGEIAWDGQYAVVTFWGDPMPYGPWLRLYGREGLLAEGPMAVRDGVALLRTPPLRGRPTEASVVAHPYRGAREILLSLVRKANDRGRVALRLEATEPRRALAAWRECAEAWLAADEVGRAALALDRAADAAERYELVDRERELRQRAEVLAPLWAWPMLGGRTGDPHRPLWGFTIRDDDPRAAATLTSRVYRNVRAHHAPDVLSLTAKRGPGGGTAARPLPRRRHGAPLRLGEAFPKNTDIFVGRDDLLEEIEFELSRAALVAVTAEHGATGVGKTQLVAEYVRRHEQEYDIIAWIDAENPDLVASQVAALASDLGLPEAEESPTAAALVSALNGTSANWLLVLDNANDPDDLAQLLSAHDGHVIVTSRRRGWNTLIRRTVDIGAMSERDAVDLLKNRTDRAADDPAANEIVRLLRHLPLAIEQAGGYMASTGTSAADYLRLLRDSDPGTFGPALENTPAGYARAVAVVWGVSRADLMRVSPAGDQLLQLCAFWGPTPVPVEVFTGHPEALPTPLRTAATRDLTGTVKTLEDRSLVQRSASGGLTVHQLLADAIRDPMDDAQRATLAATVQELFEHFLVGKHSGDPRNDKTLRTVMLYLWSHDNPDLLNRVSTYFDRYGLSGAARRLRNRARAVADNRSRPGAGGIGPGPVGGGRGSPLNELPNADNDRGYRGIA